MVTMPGVLLVDGFLQSWNLSFCSSSVELTRNREVGGGGGGGSFSAVSVGIQPLPYVPPTPKEPRTKAPEKMISKSIN